MVWSDLTKSGKHIHFSSYWCVDINRSWAHNYAHVLQTAEIMTNTEHKIQSSFRSPPPTHNMKEALKLTVTIHHENHQSAAQSPKQRVCTVWYLKFNFKGKINCFIFQIERWHFFSIVVWKVERFLLRLPSNLWLLLLITMLLSYCKSDNMSFF